MTSCLKVHLSNFQQNSLSALQVLDLCPLELSCFVRPKSFCFTSQIFMELVASQLTPTSVAYLEPSHIFTMEQK